MAASETAICNLALSHIGVGEEIQNLETDKGQSAETCRRFYDTVRNEVLEEWKWPFTVKMVPLALVTADPNSEWAFEYAYPSDALKIHRIVCVTSAGLAGANRNPSRQSRIPFRLAAGTTGTVVWTDVEDAGAEYTELIEDVLRYPASFVMAFSLKLALYIVPRLAEGDPFQMRERIAVMYAQKISEAMASAANEIQPDDLPASEFQRFREGPTSFGLQGQDPLDFLNVT